MRRFWPVPVLPPMGRDGEIQVQRASVAASRAALAMAEWKLAQRRVTAPADGRIADVLARPGETMAAGSPVVSLQPPGNILVRFVVPEPLLGIVRLGDRVALACDGCPPDLSTTVSFISPQDEYTPPLTYSQSSKAKLRECSARRSLPTNQIIPEDRAPLSALTDSSFDTKRPALGIESVEPRGSNVRSISPQLAKPAPDFSISALFHRKLTGSSGHRAATEM